MPLQTIVFGPEILTQRVMDRFWAKTKRTSSGCLEWTGTRNEQGYGRFWIRETGNLRPHRVSVVWSTGKPIPNGMDVDHLCHNTSCVEPTHLRSATRRENLINSSHPGGATAEGKVCHRGHDLTVEGALAQRSDGVSCRKCHSWRQRQRSKTTAAREKRNEKRRRRMAEDPEWAEARREYDRERYVKKKAEMARQVRKGER